MKKIYYTFIAIVICVIYLIKSSPKIIIPPQNYNILNPGTVKQPDYYQQ
ncbi:Uncharacterised protein [Yersinia bercovieri]|uniref:Uncharacterized protein n=1 Tax=Yersinia bercovieri ATCC 43970 TaxID=349968 RepID=A0ABM9Y0J8_YERBE|nr:hypothetical protein yberc0001_3500 [Yersinia bercovieri ATCC 43970]CNF71759.1 Uncharacterised protein [Yersinia bercovieri]CNI38037.1 Uncharacterised protein [Yersinia bercovieri]